MTHPHRSTPRARRTGAPLFGAICVALAASAATPAMADAQRSWLGLTFLGANDDFGFGDILDRWRTGAISIHGVHGTGWTGADPVGFGDVLEFRFRGEILAPESLDNPEEGDRPYAGTLSFGVHSYFRQSGLDYRLGADLVLTGPQTGLDELQANLHESMSLPDPSKAAETQIGDASYLVVSGEAARAFPLGASVSARPFASARVGDETFARIGVDLVGGSFASGGLLIRDVTTGQLVEGTRGAATGFGWSLGADIASVASSVYLPDNDTFPRPENVRSRARAGLMWAGQSWSVQGGLTWLSEEFEGQSEGQVVGEIALTIGF
ncbi:MAG: lipid A-modifier LpxR family protein [Pseudomonadota bacterium]